MSVHQVAERKASVASLASWFAWLGGSNRLEPRERSAYAVVGIVVLINAALAWLATTFAIWPTMQGTALVVVPFTVAFAVLVGATGRVIAAGPTRGVARRGVAAAAALALVLGAVIGECAALGLFSGSIDHVLEQQNAHKTDSAPAVLQESTKLLSMREARAAVDHAVDTARAQRDEALVIARCEYHPTSACPQTRITGVPGAGPEARTANELLADSQRELDQAVAARASQAPELEARINDGERILDQARQRAAANADLGMGARWVAMQQLTSGSAGTLTLRILTDGFFIFLGLLPLFFRHWRGETSDDRHARAHIERESAELLADTAIAVKQAEVRAATETLWADQQLAYARLAVDAQTEIDRAQLRQRVNAAIESSGAANLPATPEPSDVPAVQAIPTIPDVTRAAARWIRPLVPEFVTRAIDTSTHPLRTARHVIEEVEHITFSLKRTRRLTIETEQGSSTSPTAASSGARDALVDDEFFAAKALAQATPADDRPKLTKRERPGELRGAHGPRELPPAG